MQGGTDAVQEGDGPAIFCGPVIFHATAFFPIPVGLQEGDFALQEGDYALQESDSVV